MMIEPRRMNIERSDAPDGGERLAFPDYFITDEHGCIYVPYIETGGRAGLKCLDPRNERPLFMYFNPSSDDDAGDSNAFVYVGETGSANQDTPQIYLRTLIEGEDAR